MEQNEVVRDSREFRRLKHAPGNMTVYELVAVRIDPPGEGRWVVSCVNFGCCMEVYDGQYLGPGYIAEKMRPRIGSFGDSDIMALQSGIDLLLS